MDETTPHAPWLLRRTEVENGTMLVLMLALAAEIDVWRWLEIALLIAFWAVLIWYVLAGFRSWAMRHAD